MPEIKGIDVSSWQEVIAWDKVKADGVQFAMIRAGYSTSPDRYFKRNMVHAAEKGIHCGAYLYSHASTMDEAKEEAKFVLKSVQPYSVTYPVAFDMEDKVHYSLTKERRTEIADVFCKTIAAAGYYPIIYASLYWLNQLLDLEKLKQYDKWVAQWGTKCTFEGAFGMWQNSSRGRVSGIDGAVDTNIAYKDYSVITQNAAPPLTPGFSPPSIFSGMKFKANHIPLFKSASAPEKSKDLNGVYWVYDKKLINGRVRVTNHASRVEKLPESENVTGYVYKSDIRL